MAMEKKIKMGLIGLLVIMVILTGFLFITHKKTPTEPITDIYCDAETPCPEGYTCIVFPDKGKPVCARDNPCSYYTCPSGKICNVAESYPLQVICVNLNANRQG